MSDYLKISWGSSCSFSEIYYGDGYNDFLFIPVKKADVVEPVYEVIKKDAQEKEGRTICPDKTAKKTYKISLNATESLCDSLNTIPLAESVTIQFADGTGVTMSGDDVTINIEEPTYIKDDDINVFKVSILFLTDVTIKAGCCSNPNIIPEDLTFPVITDSDVTGATTLLTGTAPENYFVRGYFREFFQETSAATGINKISMYGTLGGWAIYGKDIYKTTDGFVTRTLKYSAAVNLNSIDCYGENFVIAVGDTGNVYYTTDGINWNNVTAGIKNFFGVKMKNSTKAAICGDEGELYLTNDSGATWTLQTTGITDKLFGLDVAVGTSDKWVVVGDAGKVLTKTMTDYTIDNNFSSSSYLAVSYSDFVFDSSFGSGTGFAVSTNGEIIKTTDYGASWTTLSTGTYTKFNSCCICKYGVLCCGIEKVLINPSLALTQIKDQNTSEITDCDCNTKNDIPYASLNSVKVLDGNIAFAQNGMCTKTQFEGGQLLITFPLANITYVVKVQAFTHDYTGSTSDDYLVYT